MCGLVGILDPYEFRLDSARLQIERMLNQINHRGPDGSGTYYDPEVGLAFGHRRLSIIDLSDNGKQPMASSSGRFVIVYNGEIYNFMEIKNQLLLEQHELALRGDSDTEILLQAIEVWGLEKTLDEINGMFAFALYDKSDRSITLVRDRIGEKPLYYSTENGKLYFSSELKSFRELRHLRGNIDRNALVSYLRHGYVPASKTIFEGIKKLEPGSLIRVRNQDGRLKVGQVKSYWSLKPKSQSSEVGCVDKLDEKISLISNLLEDSVRSRLVSDVPLGALLSGGIDSSLIVALMQKNSINPIKTYTVGFSELEFNEADSARAISKYLGTDHTEIIVSQSDALELVSQIPRTFCEPFADSSQLPTMLVYSKAKENVSVCLSGDGGDELFGGYQRYYDALVFNKKVDSIPHFLRSTLACSLSKISAFSDYKKVSRLSSIQKKIGRFSKCLNSPISKSVYLRYLSHWVEPANLVVSGEEDFDVFENLGVSTSELDFLTTMRYVDALNYLPDDILVKLDRASMSASVEGRLPFLDFRLVELAFQLNSRDLIVGNTTKALLREVSYKHISKSLLDRPKKGFGIPLAEWLRTELKDWANDLLSERCLSSHGLFEVDIIRNYWLEHINGINDWHYLLWDVLMFQCWYSYEFN